MSIENITIETAAKWIEDDNALLIDVREADEYATLHIPDAYFLPLSKITQERIDLAAIGKAQEKDLNNTKIILYCKGGQRSLMACEKLAHENPDKAFYNMDGGILAWEQKNLSTQS